MARLEDITRDEIQTLVNAARNSGQNEGEYVRAQLTARYPGIENQSIRRGPNVFSVLDYLVEDTDSYATGS